MGEASFPIRITDPTLSPDHINLALQQVGGGYILCALNRDGTQITCTPAMGTTLEECLAMLDEADRLAGEVAAQLVTDSMTDREKAEALYAYLTAHVQYDQRYYSDRANMPYESHTAVGALRDGQAICGGYAHALKLLFEHAGIPCYNVTGKYFSEPHMWNVAQLDGEWLWQPKAYHAGKKEAVMLAPCAKKCIVRDTPRVWAAQLNCRLEVLVWGDWRLGEIGDWLVCQEDDHQNAYIIPKSTFEQSYEKVE